MNTLKIVQYFKLVTAQGRTHRFQNYFVGSTSTLLGETYDFAPFRADGALASLTGENQQFQVLFPNLEYALRLVEEANGNRLSQLTFSTAWLDGNDQIDRPVTDYYLGIGASFSDTTIELRFRSAIDSVGSQFPGRTLTRDLVGPLPLNAELYLR